VLEELAAGLAEADPGRTGRGGDLGGGQTGVAVQPTAGRTSVPVRWKRQGFPQGLPRL